MANNAKRAITVNYCKEAMEKQLESLSSKDIDLIVINIAKILHGSKANLDIFTAKKDEKTGEITNIKIPIISFLRTDRIKKELKAIGITEYKINKYIESIKPTK